MMNWFNKYSMVLLVSVVSGAYAGPYDGKSSSVSGIDSKTDSTDLDEKIQKLHDKMFTPKEDKDKDKDK